MASGEKIPVAAEEEVILLTQVVEESPIEPVLELAEGEEDFPARPPRPPQTAVASPGSHETDDSLADLLAALKEFPPDFAASEGPPEPAAPSPAAPTVPLTEAEVAAVVRQVAAEIIERLAREVVPQVAERLVAEELRALKRKLCRED